MPLNPKQLKFVERYLATGNATQSYIDAYGDMSRKAAQASSAKLLSNPMVKERVDAAKAEAVASFPLTYEGALSNMWEHARYYGEGASHMARVKATERVMEHFRPPTTPPPGITVHVNDPDELRRRIEQLRTRILAVGVGPVGGDAGEPGRLLPLAPAGAAEAEVQLGLAAPEAGNSAPPQAGD